MARSTGDSVTTDRREMYMTSALDGVMVLDLSRVLAGPFCGMMLADMGADVLKIEEPEGGDESRTWPPFVAGRSLWLSEHEPQQTEHDVEFENPRGPGHPQAVGRTGRCPDREFSHRHDGVLWARL